MDQAPSKEVLRFGPLTERSLHLCVDMQNLFAEHTPWHTPWMKRVLPKVARLAEAHPDRTAFTRFIPPERPEDMPGSWKGFYERWRSLTAERIEPRLLELVPPLARLVPPAAVFDKYVYSPFANPALKSWLEARRADALIITGTETDVCVLAAVLDAVDLGYRVILPTDAVCSSSDATHDALMTLYCERFSQQIETVDSATVLAAWR
jgi:nicotinamidase-related amidase